jgi:hypothetical protein
VVDVICACSRRGGRALMSAEAQRMSRSARAANCASGQGGPDDFDHPLTTRKPDVRRARRRQERVRVLRGYFDYPRVLVAQPGVTTPSRERAVSRESPAEMEPDERRDKER